MSENSIGNFPAVQWLGLGIFTAVAWVPSLAGELISLEASHTSWPKMKENSIATKYKQKLLEMVGDLERDIYVCTPIQTHTLVYIHTHIYTYMQV